MFNLFKSKITPPLKPIPADKRAIMQHDFNVAFYWSERRRLMAEFVEWGNKPTAFCPTHTILILFSDSHIALSDLEDYAHGLGYTDTVLSNGSLQIKLKV